MKIEEIYKIVASEFGWRRLPNGNHVKLGNYVKLGNHVTLGDYVKLGNYVTLGDGVMLGDGVTRNVTPIQVQCHPYVVYAYSDTEIGVGCVVQPVEYWMKDEDPIELEEHRECKPWSTYREAIALVAKFMGK